MKSQRRIEKPNPETLDAVSKRATDLQAVVDALVAQMAKVETDVGMLVQMQQYKDQPKVVEPSTKSYGPQ